MRAALIALLASTWLMVSQRAPAANAHDSLLLEEQPRFGVYYNRYEPAFYTGSLHVRAIHGESTCIWAEAISCV
jgi:hypothetical protein